MVHAGGAPIDRYVVLEHLSEGGMGAIYVGKKMGAGGFEMEVVLKQLLPEFTQQEEFIEPQKPTAPAQCTTASTSWQSRWTSSGSDRSP
jgi:hypothetical protein